MASRAEQLLSEVKSWDFELASPGNASDEGQHDAMMANIMAAIELSYAGQRDLARTEFERIWASLGRDPDSFRVCVLSHFMADLQDDVRQELEWDLRALDAASQLTDARVQELHPSLTVAGFLPSLHLNVADACFRAGEIEAARQHLNICLAMQTHLSDSPFDALTRKGIEGLALRLSAVAT